MYAYKMEIQFLNDSINTFNDIYNTRKTPYRRLWNATVACTPQEDT